jgi:CTP:molybdopterin cytidylyltransferase MocA
MTDKQTLFADGILEASVNFGVARITLAQTGSDGKPVMSGQLLLPVVQLPAFTNGMMTLLKQIEAKVKQAQAQQAEAVEAIRPDDVPGAFRFSG